MAAEQKTTLLQRSSIRTMRKDLKRLREADVVQESKKIIQAEVPAPTPVPPKKIVIQAVGAPEVKNPVATSPQNIEEIEKQKAFLLKQQQEELEAKAKKIKDEKEALMPEKNALVQAQKKWESSLNPIIEKQNKANEDEQAAIEKKRWPIEQELAKIKTKINEVDEKYQHYEKEEQEVSGGVAKTQATVQNIQNNLEARKEQKKQEAATPTQKVPTPTEDQRRKKFMEDIEAWASSQDKNPKT